MDDPQVDPAALRCSLAFLTRLNRMAGGVDLTLTAVEKLAPTGRELHVLDIGTGAADIPLVLVHWAKRRGITLQVTAVDNHPRTLAEASQATCDTPAIEIVEADALRLTRERGGPFAPGDFDIVTASLFLHHFHDDEVVAILAQMRRLARVGVVWNDLWRNRWARCVTYAMTMVMTRIVRHDGRASIAAGFTLPETRGLARRAGWAGEQIETRLGYRFVCWSAVAR